MVSAVACFVEEVCYGRRHSDWAIPATTVLLNSMKSSINSLFQFISSNWHTLSEYFTIQEDSNVMMTCQNWWMLSHAVQWPITLTISLRGIYLCMSLGPEHFSQGTWRYCRRYNDKVIKYSLDYVTHRRNLPQARIPHSERRSMKRQTKS
jgi:hypothetical protein